MLRQSLKMLAATSFLTFGCMPTERQDLRGDGNLSLPFEIRFSGKKQLGLWNGFYDIANPVNFSITLSTNETLSIYQNGENVVTGASVEKFFDDWALADLWEAPQSDFTLDSTVGDPSRPWSGAPSLYPDFGNNRLFVVVEGEEDLGTNGTVEATDLLTPGETMTESEEITGGIGEEGGGQQVDLVFSASYTVSDCQVDVSMAQDGDAAQVDATSSGGAACDGLSASFSGSCTSGESASIAVTISEILGGGSVTLYPGACTLTLSADGGEVASDEFTVSAGEPVLAPGDLSYSCTVICKCHKIDGDSFFTHKFTFGKATVAAPTEQEAQWKARLHKFNQGTAEETSCSGVPPFVRDGLNAPWFENTEPNWGDCSNLSVCTEGAAPI